MDTSSRSVDFSVMAEFDMNQISIDELHEKLCHGLDTATHCFPTITRSQHNGYWQSANKPKLALTPCCLDNFIVTLQTYYSQPIDASKQLMAQHLFFDAANNKAVLLSRMHHSLGDASSGAMLFEVQFAAAFGIDAIVEQHRNAPLKVKRFNLPRKKQSNKPKAVNFTKPRLKNGAKCGINLRIDSNALTEYLISIGGKNSYNDLIMALCYRAVRQWHQQNAENESIILYLPINTRKTPLFGFGNASGVMYLNDRQLSKDTDLESTIHYFRTELMKGYRRGDWFVDIPHWVGKIPYRLLRFLVQLGNRLQLRGKASVVYSHLDTTAIDWKKNFPLLKRVVGIGSLIHNYPFMMNALTCAGETNLTITYNDDQLGNKPVHALSQALKHVIDTEIKSGIVSIES
jgi:hypothetical protein